MDIESNKIETLIITNFYFDLLIAEFLLVVEFLLIAKSFFVDLHIAEFVLIAEDVAEFVLGDKFSIILFVAIEDAQFVLGNVNPTEGTQHPPKVSTTTPTQFRNENIWGLYFWPKLTRL